MELERVEPEELIYYKVKLGKLTYEISQESLIAVMANQIISTNSSINQDTNLEMAFDITKNEVHDYLRNIKPDEHFVIDLFDNWFDDFSAYQRAKNKPFCKDLIVEFSDKSQWSIRLIDIFSLRSGSEQDTFEIELDDPLLNDDDLMLKWVQENLSWNDLAHFAEEIQRPQPEPDYNNEWKDAFKIIKEWENSFSILELIGESDTIDEIEEVEDSEEPDD